MLIGAAVSPYQHFGFCRCDLPDERGAQHFLFYEEDLDIARGIGLDAFRTGVEWGLLEPREAVYDGETVKLFRTYLSSAKSRGLKLWVTLHHFTNPRWVWKWGGWESREVAKRFLSYVDLVARELGDLIDVALIFNEPNTYAYLAYIRGDLPPYGFLAVKHWRRAQAVINAAIAEARDVLKQYGIPTTFTFSYTKIRASPLLRPVTYALEGHRQYMDMFREMDYTAINYYVVGKFKDLALTYVLEPEELGRVKAPTPLAVTEFGIATRDEELRLQYLCAMANIFQRVKPVAVFWWSFLHGYEWGMGYQPFFALVDVVGTTRVITPLAKSFRKVLESPPPCQLGKLDLGLEWRWDYRNLSSDELSP
ncbi:family 1 glycosylhydrolase [Pyrobaculum calidifontis]|uniref:Glycoside hydrolase, family 1 n=1 Tax=Pyrobaculum calidifontis (strain DSM 21063 / JCM 11548 / VA1) TaxID=410359 RepID=A3MTT9_PYRCJ|nr:family 1 glycosylhydrolase [Pyrobaculum calidifontis]ABO08056.1 glycoside hydrolase, family 1 [Pyrobaculum calidifontis JCM 11548]